MTNQSIANLAIQLKNKYELILLEKGASFVAADPDTNTLIIGVKNPEVVDWALKNIRGVRIKFIRGGMSAWNTRTK